MYTNIKQSLSLGRDEIAILQQEELSPMFVYLLLYLLFKEYQGILVNDFMYDYSN